MVRANSTKQEFEPILSVGSLDLTKDSLQELQQLFAKKSLTELSNVQALKTLLITIISTTIGVYAIHLVPTLLLPVAWVFVAACMLGVISFSFFLFIFFVFPY